MALLEMHETGSFFMEGNMSTIQDLIHPEETQKLLSQLIRSRSLNPPGDVRECAMIVAEELKARGLPTETIEDKPGVVNVVSLLEGRENGKTMIWNGHFDVVPPEKTGRVIPLEERSRMDSFMVAARAT
jgi:acetylornithine deacetylase/succinyl-diaminopimelate desuccinylase-like protein